MVRTTLPYVYAVRRKLASGKWKLYYRFRRGKVDSGLPSCPGDKAFHDAYADQLALFDRIEGEKVQAPRQSFAWLCDAYLASAEFEALAPRTQDDYRQTIENRLRPVLGPERFDCITRPVIKALRDGLRSQPRTAHKIKQTVSRLYSWADENDLVTPGFNPAQGVKKLKAKVKPITIWSDEECALFLARCDRSMETAVLLALYTGQRREDLVLMDWSDFQGAMIRVKQNKTGEPLDIPTHPVLKAHLDGLERRRFGGKILRGQDGMATNANALSAALYRAIAAIPEMPHRSWHGLRYACAGRLEAAGCTITQISSIIGHRTYQMAMKYASQRSEAQAAQRKLGAA
jgi:integrase